MKKLIIISVMTGLIFAGSNSVAKGRISYGTLTAIGLGGSNSTPSSFFEALANFGDKGAGIQALLNDYGSFGVGTISDLRGAGALFARYGFSSQDRPNLDGKGPHDKGGPPWDRDDMIAIDLEPFASMVGMAIANNTDDPEFLNLYNSVYSLLESHQTATGTNVYAAIPRGIYGILHLNGRDFTAINDITIPAPGALVLGGIGAGFVEWLRRRRTL